MRSFRSLSELPADLRNGIIGFYGGFQHGDVYSIILEYANEGTLEQFFQSQDTPSCGEDLIALWTSWVGVVKGLVSIHEQQRDSRHPPGFQVLQG